MFRFHFFLASSLICLAVVLGGCESTVFDPFENDERYFTVYGYIDVLETNHKIRVIPVTRQTGVITSPADGNAFIDAEVTSTELVTGNTVRWRHALEKLEDGTYAHIFRSSFRVQAGRTYRLEITRSDGIVTSAETTVPFISTATLLQRNPITYSADSTVLSQRIHIPGVASPWKMDAIYLWSGGTLNTRMNVPYERTGSRSEDGGWDMTINLTEDQAAVRADIQSFVDAGIIAADTPVTLVAMGLRIRVLDDRWDPPEGIFDPEILASPGTLTNVVNGYGFWGSVGLYTQEWNICELSEALGYVPALAGC